MSAEPACHTSKALRGAFLDAMSRVAATVCVVTTDGPRGPVGATVTAMISVSADGPAPMLLICLHKDGQLGAELLGNDAFAVNILGADQAWVSDIFAGRRGHAQPRRFDAVGWAPLGNGAPGLDGAVARLACRVQSCTRVGSHDVIFGAVSAVDLPAMRAPLIYAQRAHARLERTASSPVETRCA